MKWRPTQTASRGYRPNERGGISTVLLVCNLVVSLVLGLGLVWFGNDCTDTGYTLRSQQRNVEAMLAHNDKLEVEREFLFSPAEMQRRAGQLGLAEARPGQVRRIQEMGN